MFDVLLAFFFVQSFVTNWILNILAEKGLQDLKKMVDRIILNSVFF